MSRIRSKQRRSFQPKLELLEDRCLLASYIVAPTGSDGNPGTLASPFATIQHALEVAQQPGDIVSVRSGTYHEKIVFPASGTAAGGYITLQAYDNETPILDGTGVVGSDMVLLENISFVKFIGFEIVNLTGVEDGSGVRIIGSGSNLEIRDNTIHEIRGISAMGITVYGTGKLPITNLVIDGNHIYDAEPAPSEALTLNGNVSNFLITNNRVHDVNNIGIDLIGGERDIHRSKVVRNGVVRGNVVYNAHSNYEDGFAAGIYVDGAKNITIENNISHHNDIGMEIGAENRGIKASGITVRNNLIYLNDKAGLAFGGYGARTGRVTASRFYNNTLYKNDTLNAGFGQLWIQYASKNVVTNNIFYADVNNVLLASDAGNKRNTLDNNLWFSEAGAAAAIFFWNGEQFTGFDSYRSEIGQDAASLFGDPDFLAALTGDFHLLVGSPAMDAGTSEPGRFSQADFEGRSRLQDAAPDIGAYEYGTAELGGLSAEQKRRAEQLTSVFENDTIELQYAYIEALGDGRGYTAGRAGFTTATADLLDVVERYTALAPDNRLARYLPRLRKLALTQSDSIAGLKGIMPAWQLSAIDPLFRDVQDQVVSDTYYQPAVARWHAEGLTSALGLAVLYDTIIQHGEGDDPDGLPALILETNNERGGNPGSGVDETLWLTTFLQIRRAHLAFAFDPATLDEWAASTPRCDVWQALVDTGNLNLDGPIVVESDVYSDVTIP